MLVVKDDSDVPDNVLFGITSGSCWYVVESEHPVSVRLSLSPCVPPPQVILNGTPICFSFSVFKPLGMISSNPFIT